MYIECLYIYVFNIRCICVYIKRSFMMFSCFRVKSDRRDVNKKKRRKDCLPSTLFRLLFGKLNVLQVYKNYSSSLYACIAFVIV